MRQAEMGAAALEVLAGNIDFAGFARITRARWEWWASRLSTRYRLPSWYGRDDVRQDLLIWAWEAIGKYDRERSPNIGRYVEFSATKRTAKRISKAQGVEQHRRSGAVNVERPSSDAMPDVAMDLALEAEGERDRRYEVLARLCETSRQRYAIAALKKAPGSLAHAGAVMYSDPFVRRALRLASEEQAAACVEDAVAELTNAYGNEEARAS